MQGIRSHFIYSNVMSTLAVFVVLAGGTAWAAGKVGTSDLKNGAVTTKKLHGGAVTTKKIQGGAVATGKFADDAVAPKARIGLSPVAYAAVMDDGTVNADLTRGLSDDNIVTNPVGSDPGTFCIKGVPGVETAMVVADTAGGNNHATIRIGEAARVPNYCGAVEGTQFAVSTFDLSGGAEKPFYIWFFD